MKSVKAGFNKYYKLVTDTAANKSDTMSDLYNISSDQYNIPSDKYNIDADINLTVNEQGMQRDTIYLSAGYRDLTAVCMRMALIEAMFGNDETAEKPIIIFDDPFVNLDSYKTELAKKMLEQIAKEYQIIYFTCHKSRNILNNF